MRQIWFSALIAAGMLGLGGCGSSSQVEPGSDEGPAATAEPLKRRDAASLPPVDDYLPPLDDGRVEIAPPKGWKTLARMPKYLVNFNQGKSVNDFPRISITAENAPAGTTDLTEANAYEFAAAVAAQLRAEKKKAIAESPKPIILGDRVWSRYVRNPFFGGDPIAIQMLQTVHGGRQYNVELIVNVKDERDYAADLQTSRDAAYSVAAHMKFPAGE